MAGLTYKWKRYWCPREGAFNLSDGGYLVEPEGEYGRILAHDVRPYADIAATPCLILLGEPGIGKSTALDEITTSESAEFETLKVDLGEYSSDDRLFRHVLENEVMRAWLCGTHTLSLLLDSLDECRVAGIAKILARELVRMPTERMRLRLACRTAVWPITLEETLRAAWGKEQLGVYELAPLTKANVAEAATKSGVFSDLLLDEIERVRAQPLAIKPVSLRFLLNQFQASKCLPADEHALYMEGCYCLCEESQDRQDAGAPHACDASHRFAIAQRIAYLTIFSGKYAVWTGPRNRSMPTEDLPESSVHGSDVCDGVAFDVAEDKLRDTLNTGLFTARGPHRMGWAHQTYGEFLAAQYVLARLDATQRRSLLLLADTVGADVVPQLSEVAARVASSDVSLFDDILESAPNVLLRSDVATSDYSRRAALLSSILRKCDTGDIHFRDVDHADRLRHLNHPDIATQLRPYVTQDTFGLHARVLALDTLEACRSAELQEEILDLALDRSAHIELRCRALGILGERVDAELAAKIRPLAADMPDDPDRRLKGYVLRALWPAHLSAEELFALLTPKERNRLMCAYDMFLSHEVVDTLRPHDMPAALAWAKAQGRRHELDSHLQRLLDGLLIKAWDMLDEPGVLPLLADTLGRRLIIEHGHIMDGTEFQESAFLADDRKRRLLVTEMVGRVKDVEDDTLYLSNRCANIARPSDFAWLIDCAMAPKTEAEGQVWAKLCRWNYNMSIPAETDAVLTVYADNPAIQAEFGPLLEPIELDSDKAAKLREEHAKYSRYSTKHEEPPLLDPPPAVRVERLLDRCEAGESKLWWCVARELTLEPRSTRYDSDAMWQPGIESHPGWAAADERTRDRIRRAAKDYILQCDDTRSEWLGKGSTIVYQAHAGYQAFRLVHHTAPAFISELTPDDWDRWAVALLYHPLNISDEEANLFHRPFVEQMFKAAPGQATQALCKVIERETRQSGFLGVLGRVEHVKCPELAQMLKDLLSERALKSPGIARAVSCVIAQDTTNGVEWALQMIPSPVPKNEQDRDHALGSAEALCSPATQKGWSTIWSAMNADVEFGRDLVGRLASFFRSDAHPLSELTDDQLADLYVWVSRQFPHREDPDIDGAHSVSKREEIAHWREQYLLQLLKNRGTLSACNAIHRMLAQLPELPWLRFTWLEAVKAMRSHTWQPLGSQALLQLVNTANSRAVSSGDDLLQAIEESLGRLQDQLRGQTPMVKLLWDYQRERKTWCPKDEGSVSDFVAGHLRRDLRENGVVVNREVEIRPLRGTQSGQETDILVEALAPSTRGEAAPVQVIIETKGCWNADLDSAMQTQLVERYLADNQCRHGLYLVAYFQCDSWDDTDYRKRQCSYEDLASLAETLVAQATVLSESDLTLSARVMDLRF